MKKILFAAAIVIGSMSVKTADAQIKFNLNLNIGSQPDWGPVGYDHADYYYMPDVDAYYDVPAHRYVYFENNVWVHRTYLPARYRNYNLYNGYKVVVNRPSPWLKHSYYRTTYASYRGRAAQPIIRDSREVKYANHWNGGARPGRVTVVNRPERVIVRHDNGNHFGQRGGNGNHGGGHDNGNHGGGKEHGGGNGRGHGHN